jgi:serine O-acetyltransferase
MSPLRLWKLSMALRRRGFRRTALLVKKVNSALYHNSLAPGATIGADLSFGHHGFGTVIHSNVEIGSGVMIWHNVTIAVYAATASPHKVVIEDDVMIGANSVIVCPKDASIRIGRGARIGAGAVVSGDVPAGATVVSAPVRVILRERSPRQRAPDANGPGASQQARVALSPEPDSATAHEPRQPPVSPGPA